MSASFWYVPNKKKSQIGCGTSTTAEELRDLFGTLPVTLTKKNYAQVQALRIAGGDKKFWERIECLLDTYDSIEVGVDY